MITIREDTYLMYLVQIAAGIAARVRQPAAKTIEEAKEILEAALDQADVNYDPTL